MVTQSDGPSYENAQPASTDFINTQNVIAGPENNQINNDDNNSNTYSTNNYDSANTLDPNMTIATANSFDQASIIKASINAAANSIVNTVVSSLDLKSLSSTTSTDTPRPLTNGQSITLYPQGGGGTETPIIYINGIDMSSDQAQQEGQILANITNRPVDAIYQKTDLTLTKVEGGVWGGITSVGGGTVTTLFGAGIGSAIAPGPGTIIGGIVGFFTGFFATATSLAPIEVKALLKNDEASKTEAGKILNQLGDTNSNNQVHVVAYSQGAAITAQTLSKLKDQLKNQYGEGAANKMMSRINVLSLGGAANIGDFPKEVNVVSAYRQKDVVSQYLGDNSNGLEGFEFDLKPHLYYLSDPNVRYDIIPRWLKGELKRGKVSPLPNNSAIEYPSVQFRYSPVTDK